MVCSLPTGCGAESTSILVFRGDGGSLTYIVATTDPASLELRMPAGFREAMRVDAGQAGADRAAEMLLWADERIKDVHIKKNCTIKNVEPTMADAIMAVVSVSFMHPSAVFSRDVVEVAAARWVSASVLKLDAGPLQGGPGPRATPAERGVAGRAVALMSWTIDARDAMSDGGHVLRVPCPCYCPATAGEEPAPGKMNATVIVAGDLVHPSHDGDRPRTFDVAVAERKEEGRPCIARATVTYLKRCPGDVCPHGLHYPTTACPGIDNLRTTVHPNGVVVRDSTGMGLARSVDYGGAVVPLVCGSPLVDRVRFERATIPYAIARSRSCALEFRDSREGGRVDVLEDGALVGCVNTTDRRRRGDIVWLTLMPPPLPLCK